MKLSFKDFYSPEPVVEVAQKHVDKLHPNLQQLIDDERLPFNQIFGRKLRIAEVLNGGTEYETNITKHLQDYDVDFPSWTGYKKSDTTKKNPTKIGKALNKRKEELTKFLKAPELDDASRKVFTQQLVEVDNLLKITNMQKQWENARQTAYVIIYSRAPVDVLRMGDFDWQTYSCHSPGGDYFKCAIADAMLNAGVIYLVKAEDYKQIKNLQAEEIFSDNDRSIDGILPVARMRIRAAIDKEGNTIAVPTTKIYAVKGQQFNDEFKKQVLQWAKNQDVSKFDWDNKLTMPGGTYEDGGYQIDQMIQTIWGKTITYRKDGSDQPMDEDDEDEWQEAEDHFMDECRGEIDTSKIQDRLFDDNNPERVMETEIEYNGSDRPTIEFSFLLDDYPPLQKIDKKTIRVRNAEISFSTYHISVIITGDYIEMTEYVDFNGPDNHDNDFNKDSLHEDVAEKLNKGLRTFTGSGFSFDEGEGEIIRLKYELINTILKSYELPAFQLPHADDLNFFIKSFVDKSVDITEPALLPVQHHPMLNYKFEYRWLKIGSEFRPGGIPQALHGQYADIIEEFETNLAIWQDKLCNFLVKRYKLDMKIVKDILVPNIHCEGWPNMYAKYEDSEGWKNTKLKRIIFDLGKDVPHPTLTFALRMDNDHIGNIITSGDFSNYLDMILDLVSEDFEIDEDFPDNDLQAKYNNQKGSLNIHDIQSSLEDVFNRISHKLSGPKELDLNSFKAFFFSIA